MANENNVHILRTTSITDNKIRFWILFDRTNKLHGRKGESKQSVIKRWELKHGKPPAGYVRYKRLMRPSEVACTISCIMYS